MTPTIAPLRNVAAMLGLIEQVQSRAINLPGMATFYGPSGWGKTTAVTFAANDFNAHCVQVKHCWTKTYLCGAIMRELGLKEVRGVAAMVDAIGNQLAITDRPLIIDDAQYLLRGGMIETVRDIYESCQAPVILVGEEKLPQDLTKWENVHNRILEWMPAEPCSLTDAQHLIPFYSPDITIKDDLLEAIVKAAGGSIGRVAKNLSRVRELTRKRGGKEASLHFWGDRGFDTGQPPQRPRDQQMLASAQIVSLKAGGRK